MEDIKKDKAIAYCRVATVTQTNNHESLERQKRKITEYAKRKNIEIVEWFEQVGLEPVTFPYDTLGEALSYCKTQPDIKFLIVSDVDRLSRSIGEYYFWNISFQRKGVAIKFTDSKEIESLEDNLMNRLMSLMGQADHEQRSIMIKRGIQRKKERLEQQNKTLIKE